MNDTPVKVGGIYKLKPDYNETFFGFYDHGEKYVMVLSEDYSGMHPCFNVLVFYKEGPLKTAVENWNFRAFNRWEIFSETG